MHLKTKIVHFKTSAVHHWQNVHVYSPTISISPSLKCNPVESESGIQIENWFCLSFNFWISLSPPHLNVLALPMLPFRWKLIFAKRNYRWYNSFHKLINNRVEWISKDFLVCLLLILCHFIYRQNWVHIVDGCLAKAITRHALLNDGILL